MIDKSDNGILKAGLGFSFRATVILSGQFNWAGLACTCQERPTLTCGHFYLVPTVAAGDKFDCMV